MLRTAWIEHNPDGKHRVVVTKELPGRRWLQLLADADCHVEMCREERILDNDALRAAIGERCDGVIGQLTERWDESLFSALRAAGGCVYSNYAVGYDNVDVAAATRAGIAVCNTPGVLTHATSELAVTLTMAAARRIVEADRFTREGHYTGWLPNLFLGEQMRGKTLGVIGAGRIGSAYARTMVEAFKMNLIYCDPAADDSLTTFVEQYNVFLADRGEGPLSCERTPDVDQLLRAADVVSLHLPLNDATFHIIDAERLGLMKPEAVLVNTSRGAVIDEQALVGHCMENSRFRVGLDVFEHEPELTPGLVDLANVVVAPHIASATVWAREGMATLAACNVAGRLQGWPAADPGVPLTRFLDADPPRAVPSVVNPGVLEAR